MRLEGYDYTQTGTYFFTICTYKRKNYFGKIHKGIMGLSLAGCLVWDQWFWLAQQYPYVQLDSFIVMPNHVHGILIINETSTQTLAGAPLVERTSPLLAEGLQTRVDTQFDLYRLIQAFKSRCTKHIRESGMYSFKWQESFREIIIDYENAYNRIHDYILANPLEWHRDRNNLDREKFY